MEALAWISAIGSLVTALAAVAAIWIAVDLQGRVVKVEEARHVDERSRAQSAYVTAAVERWPTPVYDRARESTKLVLRNIGQAQGRNVDVRADSLAGEPLPYLHAEEDLPIKAMDPEGIYPLSLHPAMGDELSMLVTVTWDDHSGHHTNVVQLSQG